MVVTIDGPAGVGKSTVAACAAKRTGFLYVNSGAFYRGVSKTVLESRTDPDDVEAVLGVLKTCSFDWRGEELFVNGRPAGDLQTERIDHWSSILSRIPQVRVLVNSALRGLARLNDVIVEGRDIGTEVFPGAGLKIYLDASLETRARRRCLQIRDSGGRGPGEQAVQREISIRDERDRNRPLGRLNRAEDAVYLDTSDLTIEEVCARVVREILITCKQSGDKKRA